MLVVTRCVLSLIAQGRSTLLVRKSSSSFPYTGEAILFDVRPSSFTLSPPWGDVHNGELHLIYSTANPQFDLEAQAERTITEIKQHLDHLRESEEPLRREL